MDSDITLRAGEVHVWHANLHGIETRADWLALLDTEERSRAERRRDSTERAAFIAAHARLRILLGRYLDSAPGEIAYRYGAYGKPELMRDPAPGLRFNASRTKSYAIFAFAAGQDVGVDVEELSLRTNIDGVAKRAFSAPEIATLRTLPQDAQRAAFFAMWVRKEAYLKATGTGLSVPPTDIEIREAGQVFLKGVLQSQWRVLDVASSAAHKAAVCAAADARITLRREVNL